MQSEHLSDSSIRSLFHPFPNSCCLLHTQSRVCRRFAGGIAKFWVTPSQSAASSRSPTTAAAEWFHDVPCIMPYLCRHVRIDNDESLKHLAVVSSFVSCLKHHHLPSRRRSGVAEKWVEQSWTMCTSISWISWFSLPSWCPCFLRWCKRCQAKTEPEWDWKQAAANCCKTSILLRDFMAFNGACWLNWSWNRP